MVCSPLCGVECRGLYPAFASDSSEIRQLGGVFFFGFVSFGPEFAPIVHVQLFLVSYSFFVFCSLRRGVSRCKLCLIAAKGPGSQTCLSLFPINL